MPNYFREWRELSSSFHFFLDIVACFDNIFSPLQNHNGYSVSKSLQFSQEISNTSIHDDEGMVSFNVVKPCTLPSPLTKHEQLLYQEKNSSFMIHRGCVSSIFSIII